MAAILIAAALALTGCGGGGATGTRAPTDATLVLDFTPNAIHTGIYTALAHRYDLDEGVRLQIVAPSASTDSVKLLETGRANFAILDIHDLAIARERGADLVGIMAIVQRPLAAVIAVPGVGSPRALAGKTVGITGDPSDTAVLHSIVAGAHGNPRSIKTITIGFNAVPALLSGRVAAATAFWNDEGVTLQQNRPGFHIFRVEQYGAPAYPELILCATQTGLAQHSGLARAVVAALVHGYRTMLSDPAAGEKDLESLVPGLDPKLVSAQLSAELPAFVPVGELNLTRLDAWARWEARFGIVSEVPDVRAMFDPGFVTAGRAG